MPEAIKVTRFNYFREKQERLVQDFRQFFNSKIQNADLASSEPETQPEDTKTCTFPEHSNQTSASYIKSDPIEIHANYFETKSQSTPNIRIKQSSSTYLSAPNLNFLQKPKQKISPNHEERLKKHKIYLESIAHEKEQNLIQKLKKIENNSKNLVKTSNPKTHEKLKKIKEKHKEQQEVHEQLIKESLKKYLEVDKRIEEKRDKKQKEQMANSKNTRKDLIENKKRLENEKEVERHMKYINKVKKINEIRRKADDRFNDIAKTPRIKLERLNHEGKKSDEWVLKTERNTVNKSPRSDNEKEEKLRRQITKKELNRLIVDTRITRNKFRMVVFM